MDKDMENSISDNDEAITKDEEKEDMDRSDGSSTVKRKRQDSLNADSNSDDNEIARKIRKVSSEDISTAQEDNENRLTKEQEENCTLFDSSQDILTSEHENNSTALENDEPMLSSECEVNSKLSQHGQGILTSEHEDNTTVPESGQEILRLELGEKFTAQEMGQEILTTVREENSTAPESDQEILTSEHENASTEPESGQEMLKSEYEVNSKVLETDQELLISDREDESAVKDIVQEILLSEDDGNATLPENLEEIASSENENKSIVTECGQEMLTSEQTDSESEQNCEVIPTETISEEDTLQRFVVEVERAWKVVNSLTGFKLGIVPPMCLSQGQNVGHWINLSKEVIPFVYVTSTGDSINEVNEIPFGSDHIKTKSATAALLITEYVNRVINQLELEQSDALESVKETLKNVSRLLQSFIEDVDSITLSSTTQNLPQTLSKIKELEHSIDQLSLIGRNDLSTPTEKMVTVTECHLICFIIGLGDELTQKMIDITDERVMHKSPYYIIENFIDDGIYEIVKESGNNFEGDMKSKLVLLGFSQEKSQKMVDGFSFYRYRTHNFKFYFVKEYLENLFSTHPLLMKMQFLDKYANRPMGEWFDDEVYQRVDNGDTTRKLHLQVIKSQSVYSVGLTSTVINHKFENYGHTLLFHGAKQANYLESFLREGIKLSCSENKQDFSYGRGFYLSDDFNAAKDWVEKRRHRPNAVIIYRVPNNLLVFGDTAGLDLSRDKELWSSIVKYHRTGYMVERDVPDRVNLDNRSFIKGPVCQNGMKLRRRKDVSPIPLLMNGRELQQYSIRGQKLAMELSSLVAGVVIYN